MDKLNSTTSSSASNSVPDLFASTTYTELWTTVTATLSTNSSSPYTTVYTYLDIVTGSEQFASLFSSTSSTASITTSSSGATTSSSTDANVTTSPTAVIGSNGDTNVYPQSSVVSTSTKIWIGVGVGIGGLLIILVNVFLLFKLRARRRAAALVASGDPYQQSETRASAVPSICSTRELDAHRECAELDASSPWTRTLLEHNSHEPPYDLITFQSDLRLTCTSTHYYGDIHSTVPTTRTELAGEHFP